MANYPAWLKPGCFDVKNKPSDESQLQANPYADFMELAAIANSSRSMSYGTISNAESDEENAQEDPSQNRASGILDIDQDNSEDNVGDHSIDNNILTEPLSSLLISNLTTEDGSRKNKISKEAHLSLIQTIFEERKSRMGKKWPFTLDLGPNKALIKIEFCPEHPWADKYLTLLLGGNQNFFQQKGHNTHLSYSSCFEEIGLHVFRQIFPHPWVVKQMGANATEEDAYENTTSKGTISALCEDIRMELNSRWEPSTSGDGGIDLAAFYPFDDEASRPFILGQCSCANDRYSIEQKIREVHLQTIEEKIHCQVHPMCCLLSPVSLSDPTRKLKRICNAKGVLLIDRGRILDLMEDFPISDEIQQFNQDFKDIQMNSLIHLE